MSASLPDDIAWTMLERMLLIRRFEEAVLKLSYDKQFTGHYHLYIGQEATGAAAMQVLDRRDHLATTHRNHGHVIARGADPGKAMAEILGRATGLNGGRGGTISTRGDHMGIAFPGESPEYRAARDGLLDQEVELRRTMEAVAAARRSPVSAAACSSACARSACLESKCA